MSDLHAHPAPVWLVVFVVTLWVGVMLGLWWVVQ